MRSLVGLLFRGPVVHGHRTLSPVKLGIGFAVVVLLAFWAAFSKDQLMVTLKPGDTVKVHFAEDYKLRPFISEAKISFVPIGKVSGVERQDDGTAIVSLKVDSDARDKLGSTPSATVRPTTVLGGSYFVDLQPGGDAVRFEDEMITLDRSGVPVELDKVALALQPEALTGLKSTVGNLDGALAAEGSDALKRLVADAPAALEPGASVLDAVQGENPDEDLTTIVAGLESTARTLSERDGQLDAIVADLGATSTVLGNRGADFSDAIGNLPATLDSTQAGLDRLDGTLTTLRDVAGDARPIVTELDTTLARVDPVLAEAVPVVNDLRVLSADARPLVQQLVPVSETATRVVDDVRGPVLDRVNGPVRDFLYTHYQGSGPFAQTRSDVPMYREVVHTLTNLHRVATLADENGHTVNFQPGVGTGSAGGIQSIGTEDLFKQFLRPFEPQEPIDTVGPLSRPPSDDGLLGPLDANGGN